jgi:hypothetical protein
VLRIQDVHTRSESFLLGSRVEKAADPDQQQRIEVFLTQKIVKKSFILILSRWRLVSISLCRYSCLCL